MRLPKKSRTQIGSTIDVGSLPRFRHAKILSPRNLEIYKAPLLLLREAVPATQSRFVPTA